MGRISACLFALLSLFVARGVLAAPPTDPVTPAPDLAHGADLYKNHCAMCHDNPSARTPPRAVIEQNTPSFVLSVLTQGAMRPMANGLSWQDLHSLAAYLAKRQSGAVMTAGLEAPVCTAKPPAMSLTGPKWNGWGNDANNTRFQPDPGLSAADVPHLKVKWAFAHAGGSSGQATIAGGRVFVNTSAGAVYALDAKTGCAYWRFDADSGTRSSIIIGPLPGSYGAPRFAAYFADELRNVYAVDADTGALYWKAKVDDQIGGRVTGSLALGDNKVFVPISSVEEALATNDTYECCKFRGALVALNATGGTALWKTYTTTEEPKPFKKSAKGTQMYGPAGGAIWSAPTLDEKRKLVFVGTGDSYTDAPNNGVDAIMALDMETGAVRWVHQMTPDDAFIIGCSGLRRAANCPSKVGKDTDFGASPILASVGGKDLLLAGQKSADAYALDPQSGAIVWQKKLGVGGPLGGVEFGPASDGTNVYVAISDIFMPGAKPGLSALRISDGNLLWGMPAKTGACGLFKDMWCNPALSQAVSVMPGIVFAGSMDGHFRAYESTSGKIVFDDDTAVPHRTVDGREITGGGLDGAGPTIAGGMVYVTSGYQGRMGADGGVLLAYSVDGK